MKSLLLKLDTVVYTSWKAAAVRDGLNVSEWIRLQCNRGVPLRSASVTGKELDEFVSQPEGEQSNGSTDNQDVLRTTGDSIPGRRTAAKRRAHSGSVRSAKAPSGNGTLAGAGQDSEGNLSSGPATASSSAVVVHTATSNRLTCLCPTCSEYRRANALPVGGLPKKKSRFAK